MYEEEMYPSDPTERILYLRRKLSRLLDALPVTKFHLDDEPLNEEGIFSNDPGERVIGLWRKFSRMLEALLKANFDPCQPRDEQGRWTCVAGNSGMNIDNAVAFLDGYADPDPPGKGECATYVRLAILVGGVDLRKEPEPKLPGKAPAKAYGDYLESHHFAKVAKGPADPSCSPGGFPPPGYQPQKGDIAVFQPPPGQDPPYGHIQMYNGKQWVSDFKQPNGFWPGKEYRKYKPNYAIYRP